MHWPSNLSDNLKHCLFSKGVTKHEVIDEFITIIDNEKLPFTVLWCTDYYKATHLRFFFLTREKLQFQWNRETMVAKISDDDETNADDSVLQVYLAIT